MAIQRPKRKKKNHRRRNTLIFVAVVAFSMLFSGFYYINPSGTKRSTSPEETPQYSLNRYNVEQLGNFSVLIKIKNATSDLIALPAPRVATLDRINSLQELSFPGLNYVSCDSTDLYLLCTFNLDPNLMENASQNLKEELRKKFRDDYSLMKGFIGKLPLNISGTDEVYIIGTLDNKDGEYLRVFLFQKDDGGLTGFEEKKIPSGERIPSKVLNLTGYIFSGVIEKNFNLGEFSEELELNSSEVSFSPPKFIVNETLNETLDNESFHALASLDGVEFEINTQENKTIISFNNSFENITEILKENNLTSYSFENGSIGFKSDINASVAKVQEVMEEFGIQGIEVRKGAIVSFSDEVVFDEKIVKIDGSENFPASVKFDTEEGDEINLTLSVIQFGEQIVPFGAREIEGNETGKN